MTLWGDPRTLDRNNSLTGKPRMRARTACLALALGVALVIGGSPADASQIPPGCSNSGVGLDFAKDKTDIANGQTVTYTIKIDNGAFPPTCAASNVVVKGFCPDASGQPNILKITYPTLVDMPAPTPTATLPTFSCVVNVNPGVTFGIARATVSGDLHDNPAHDDFLGVEKNLSVGILTEGIAVTKSCTQSSATAVSISGTVSNTGTDGLVNVTCSDSPTATINLSATTIPPGGTITYSGSYTSTTNPSTDTVTCNATGQIAQTPVGPASATASCLFTPPQPPTPPPAQIPTLSEWVMIMFAVFLALAGGFAMRRKRIV